MKYTLKCLLKKSYIRNNCKLFSIKEISMTYLLLSIQISKYKKKREEIMIKDNLFSCFLFFSWLTNHSSLEYFLFLQLSSAKNKREKRTNIDWLCDNFRHFIFNSMYKKQSRINQYHYSKQQRIIGKTSSQVG
jgi:hypothetical protein